MAVSSYWYINGMKNLVNGATPLGGTNTFKVALLSSGYALSTAKLQADTNLASVSANQITGTNYVAGGVNVSLAAATASTGDVIIGPSVLNTTWTSASFTARYAAIYHVTNTWLLGIVDFGQDETCSNGSFTIDWNDTAIFKITPAAIP